MTYVVEMTDWGQLTIHLEGLSADLDLFALQHGAQCDPDQCQEMSINGGASSESITLFGWPGSLWYVVVDGWSGAQSDFELHVECNGGGPVPPTP